MEYSLEAFEDDDPSAAVSLHKFLQPRGRGANEQYLRWKYFENPFIENPLITVVRYGGEIVAMTGLMGMSWHAFPGRESTIVPQIDDLIIHPDHRRKGLTALMFRGVIGASLSQGYPAMISLSGGAVSNALASTKGWTEIRELERVYLVRSTPEISLSERIPGARRVKSKAMGIARRFGYWMVAPPPARFVDAAIEPIPGNDSRISVSANADLPAMSALAATTNRHASARSVDAFRWRLGNPDRTYRFVYWRDTRLRGYMILGWTGENRQRAMIIDYCCETDSVFAEMLNAVARIRSDVVELMSSTLPQEHADVAYRLGFRPDHEHIFGKRQFFAYPLEKSGPGPDDSSFVALARTWRVDLMDTLQG